MHFANELLWEYDGWECLNCGNIDDPLILSNRARQAGGPFGPMTARGMRGARGAVGFASFQPIDSDVVPEQHEDRARTDGT